MIRINRFSSGISWFCHVRSLALCLMFLMPQFLAAANSGKPDFWVRNDAGTITHT
ncbi:MAG: hypothetical protein WC865_00965 [Bacteroidales bacterium]